jgi:DNA-binding transcriptional LysR family regulator
MKRYPKVRLQFKVFQRRADLIEDRIDIALRGRMQFETDLTLVARPLGRVQLVLVMSPELLTACTGPLTVERLADFPILSNAENVDEDYWELVGPNGETHVFLHQPRLYCSNCDLLRAAAIAGLGVALLSEPYCRPTFESGELTHVLPDWRSPDITVQTQSEQ